MPGQRRAQDHPPDHLVLPQPHRVGDVDEIPPNRLDVVHHQQHLLEEDADEQDHELLGSAAPNQISVNGTNATAGM